MHDKSSNQSQENNEMPPIEDWKLHALANHLDKALDFEAHPEFNAALRSRLLNQLEPKGNHSASFHKEQPKVAWSGFSGGLFGGGLLPQSLILGLVMVLGLVVVLNSKLPASAPVSEPTIVASVTPEMSEEDKPSYSHLAANENLLIIKERLDSTAVKKTDYSDTINARLLQNMIKKERALNPLETEEVSSFDKKFDYRPVPR